MVCTSLYIPRLLLAVVTLLLLHYIYKHKHFRECTKQDNSKLTPPTELYVFPLLGSLPLTYIWNPRGFVLNSHNFFQRSHPVRVKILNYEFYVVQGAENIKVIFKNSWACTSVPFVKFALGYAFGLPPKALSLYDKDNSGSGRVPHPDSTVEARNRVDYRVYQTLVKLLEGKGLLPFWSRFADDITTRMCTLQSRFEGSDWEHCTDLMRLVGDEATISFVNALCGPHLLRLNPTFLQDFWDFDHGSMHPNELTSVSGMPWILAPRAYAVRKRVLNAVRIWQKHARENYTDSARGADGDDPFWGATFFRDRQNMFLEMDGFDHDAIASEDFGAIWAARNSIATTSWTVFELYRDVELLEKVRGEVDACRIPGPDGRIRFNIDALLRQPVLQAVYAETLRLRMHFYMIRMPDKVDMDIRDWVIPRRKVIVTSTTCAHMDTKAWNTGVNNDYPIDQFWVGRFLKEPTHPTSTPAFSTKDLEGSWMPYGGGPRQCPGRHFAKRQILLTSALIVTLFDCEILGDGRGVKEDVSLQGFGVGISRPASKIPVRLRRRC
ncbi:cytochrome P450 [Lindgomyces ingoldianus]|uniref:Cytochrome P450 n=1 Tax=Lindgomyces ingoldianus TaxID=673940 RepID=A0ACB6QN34_9PLEO|nr:cytochrome P450 [Lindgomyces ingoldianus]KAF2468300.1 cytochrome P450 [Lindgomyces ingoldianus]